MRSGDALADRFVIERLAGSGGMGEVYRGRDQTTGQPVAIKILHGNGAEDIARFEREARILGELDDTRVVHHIAHGTTPAGDPYLVMEWLDGEDLGQRLQRGRLSPAESVALCITIAGTLGTIHDRGIIHRDLKPSNVFLVGGRADQVKLLDFGIAQVEASTRMTGTGTLIGTLGYMAPEQANGTKDIDCRTDLFALGCVLFECIAGEPAFHGTHPMAVLTKILFEEPPRLRDRCAGVPAELDALVGRLLAKNRQERPPHGHAVVDALRVLGEMPNLPIGETLSVTHSPALTDSEQRALGVILVSAPVNASQAGDESIEAAARAHAAALERLIDGSLALLISGTGMATDLAAQAAHCALAVGACAAGRRVVLAMGRAHGAGTLPMGHAIDHAVRLLDGGAAVGNAVAIDDTAVGLLDARFDVRDDSGVYVLAGERDVSEVRTLLGKPTPCVGRERELRTLDGLFDDCTGDEPRAQAVLVTAPAGVGKSRLGREFLQKVRSRSGPVSIWLARGEPLRAGSAFSLASRLVESAGSIRTGEPLEVRRDKLRARVARHVAERDQHRVTEFLGELIGTPFPAEDSLPLQAARSDPQLMNEQVRTAFSDFVAAECGANAVVVLLDDLHWGDSPTVDVLGRMLDTLSESSLFVLALARPEVHDAFPKLWPGRALQEMRMNELGKKPAERLVKHVLGDGVDADTVQRIVTLSAGNAFYLEELIRATAEGRGDHLPETVVAMVQSRLATLSDGERRMLRAASVYGETFWTSAVAALLGETHSAAGKTDGRLRALVEAELLQKRAESRFPMENEYVFRHALVREGAYALLTEDDLSLGHRLAGDWLERMGEDDPVVLAEHFEKGGEGARAGAKWALAAERAYLGDAAERGISCAHRGIACPVSKDIRYRLLGALCQLHATRMETLATARPYAEELLHVSEPGSTRWAQAMLVILPFTAQSGDVESLGAALNQILSTEMKLEATDTAALMLGSACYVFDLSANIRQATTLFTKFTSLINKIGDRFPGARAMYCVTSAVRSAYAEQDPWEGMLHAEEAQRITERIGHRPLLTVARVASMMNLWYMGDNAVVRRIFDGLHATDDDIGLASSLRPFVFAWLLADAGAFTEARDPATMLANRPAPLDAARGHWVLAEVLRRSGDLDAADTEIETALSIMRLVSLLDLPGALATRAAVRLAQGRAQDALAAAEEGMAKMEAFGVCSQFFRNSFLRLVHAQCLEACGRHDAAKAAIGKAREFLSAVESKISDAEYRRSFLEDVPENRRICELAQMWFG